jgi:hypothetical protein
MVFSSVSPHTFIKLNFSSCRLMRKTSTQYLQFVLSYLGEGTCQNDIRKEMTKMLEKEMAYINQNITRYL